MAPDPKQTSTEKLSPQELWNEIVVTRSEIDELLKQSQQTGDLKPVRAALDGLQLKTSSYERLLEEMQAPLKAVLGRNFLGTAEWERGFGVKVGRPPPIAESITPKLLNSPCPLHPGQLIKETHILVLIPKTVDGEAYSALKLAELCSTRKGSGDKLIDDNWLDWKESDWASLPQAKSEWVLLPKREPDKDKVPVEQHFSWKNIAPQQDVHEHRYSEYREAKALEVMTMALLNDVVNGAPRILADLNILRCMEPNAFGGHVVVGLFHARGLFVYDRSVGYDSARLGRALARK